MKSVCLLLTLCSTAIADLTDEQRGVPLEHDSRDPKQAKIVLLAGGVSNKAGQHEYFAGCALMMDWLKQAPGVWPIMAAEGWPKDERIFDGAKAIVVYADGGTKLSLLEPARWARIKAQMDAGVGLVMLHQAVEVPVGQAEELKSWLGAVWQPDIGSRGHWDMEFNEFSRHAILRGVAPFAAPLDGWLFKLHFAPGAVPLVTGQVPDKARTTANAKAHAGRPEIVAWAYERANGGRSFAFTGCDLHKNWLILVTNGILWSAKVEVPEAGSAVPMSAAQLGSNWDAKPVPKPTVPKPAAS